MSTRVLHGPGLGPRAGPARSPWAGPGQDSMIFCGPGRVRAWNLQGRAGTGLVSNNFAGCGPGLGLTFPGLGRAYNESHSCFNIMVKDYLPSSIHCNKIIVFYAVNVTALNGFKTGLPANLPSIQCSTMILNCWTSGEHIVMKQSDELSKYGSTKLTQSFDDMYWWKVMPSVPSLQHFPSSACRPTSYRFSTSYLLDA